MFNSGIDKNKHPEVQRAAQDAFSAVSKLALELEPSLDAGRIRALSAWALVHGLAVLNAEVALEGVAGWKQDAEDLRPVVWDFVTRRHY